MPQRWFPVDRRRVRPRGIPARSSRGRTEVGIGAISLSPSDLPKLIRQGSDAQDPTRVYEPARLANGTLPAPT